MRIGTMTSTFRENHEKGKHISYAESIVRCKNAGYTALDFNMCALLRKETELNGDDWKEQTYKLKELADSLGVDFSQSHLPYAAVNYKAKEGDKLPEQDPFFVEMCYRAIDISAILGVKWAVVHPAAETRTREYNIELDIAVNHLVYDDMVAYANSKGVGIAFENMCDKAGRRRFTSVADELIALVDSYNNPMVGICWDFGHANRSHAHQEYAILALGDRLKATHLNDNVGDTDLHLMPFLGTINWVKVMAALRKINYQGDMVYEIKMNNAMPDALKDISAKYCYEVGNYLLTL